MGHLKDEWSAWIERFVAECGGPHATLGKCYIAATAMVKTFPELRLERGHVECTAPWGRRGHWWCVAPDGTIVDPTAAQFPAIFRYDPYVEGQLVRLGSCMECGESIWGPPGIGRPTFCSKECERACAVAFNGRENLG